ncbi:hypothetical protein [Amycolatopsis alba]|nr:hypothetical protein [Amycolatopsis alba]
MLNLPRRTVRVMLALLAITTTLATGRAPALSPDHQRSTDQGDHAPPAC